MQNNSYWEIDDALMSQELIKCKCNTDNCNFLSILKIDKDDDNPKEIAAKLFYEEGWFPDTA